ncbi:MAG: ribose 5-phosphate isomerase B [Bdellovibrionales bacterium]
MSKEKILIASDHAGFELKEQIKNHFLNYEWDDLGTDSKERVDYPDFAKKLCNELLEKNEAHFGLLICGSGQGMAITANKFPNIRAALCWSKESAELSRSHNNANVLALGERLTDKKLALEIVKQFLTTEFEGGRHQDRIEKI